MKYSDKYRILRFERLKQIAAGHGGACLSTQYVSSAVKLRWRCARGHEWEALANNIARGHWCIICGNERQGRAKAHSIGTMDNIAASRGGQCLSSSYRNNLTKLRWRCARGHEWEAVPGSIVSSAKHKGSWCPICVGKLPKELAFEKLSGLATARGGALLSMSYHNAITPLRWRPVRRASSSTCYSGGAWKKFSQSADAWTSFCGCWPKRSFLSSSKMGSSASRVAEPHASLKPTALETDIRPF